MDITATEINGKTIATVYSGEVILTDAQAALDFMATMRYETDCDGIVINKEAIVADFFVLSTRLAGDILQKFTNYGMKLAIVGDFSRYTSKPLHDFIYESNRGNSVFFVASNQQAIEKLSMAI